MRKSQVKQALLAAIFGPAGLCYVSLKASLALTLITLIIILTFSQHSLKLLLSSFPVAMLAGYWLIRSHNQSSAVQDFTLSDYIGTVSCRVVGKVPLKRSYHKRLNRARLLNRLNNHANSILAGLCIFVCALIAAPKVIKQLPVDRKSTDLSVQQNPSTLDTQFEYEFLDRGVWQMLSTSKDHFSAQLKADNYQTGSAGWYRPTLTLSCRNNRTQLVFGTDEILSDNRIKMTIRLPDESTIKANWKSSSDYQSAVAPSPSSVIKQLAKYSNVEFLYQSFGETEVKTASFTLDNSQNTIQSVRNRCAW